MHHLIFLTVCTQSGKIPNEGLCDDCIRTEYFEVGTEPTEFCDVHYKGIICAYDGKIACETCPFATEGVATLPLKESELLDYGKNNIVDNHCCHNSEFYAQENYQDILNAQMWEIMSR